MSQIEVNTHSDRGELPTEESLQIELEKYENIL
jgi:hypothetical protein